MRITNILVLAAASGLVLAACGKLPGNPEAITIQAGIGTMTKVATDGAKASFESGDKISVYAWTGSVDAIPATRVVDGVVNSFDGTKWTPAAPMLWDDRTTKHYFLGVSPARTVTSFTADSYTLDPADYAASDLLIATNLKGLISKDNPVALEFSHAMARLDVNLSFRNQWATAPTVSSVKTSARKTATVDYLVKKVTATGDAASIALKAKDNASWSGLQVPQSGVRTLTITIDGQDFVFTHTADIPLESGKYTTVNLTVGRDKIELASDITIADWTSGSTLNGEAQDE